MSSRRSIGCRFGANSLRPDNTFSRTDRMVLGEGEGVGTAWRRHGEHGVGEVASAPRRRHRVTTINNCTRCCAGAKDVEFEKCYSARLSLNDMEGNASPRGCHVCASARVSYARARARFRTSRSRKDTATVLQISFIDSASGTQFRTLLSASSVIRKSVLCNVSTV